MITVHRKEQWDLERRADVKPLVCVHRRTPDGSRRVFVVWRSGRVLKVRAGRWAAHVMWCVTRPSWLRYLLADGFEVAEHGTLRMGVVQVKWTRTWHRHMRFPGVTLPRG